MFFKLLNDFFWELFDPLALLQTYLGSRFNKKDQFSFWGLAAGAEPTTPDNGPHDHITSQISARLRPLNHRTAARRCLLFFYNEPYRDLVAVVEWSKAHIFD